MNTIKKLILYIVLLGIVVGIVFFGPYRILDQFNAEDKVLPLFETLQEAGEIADKSAVKKITYKGNHLYEVQTEENYYLTEVVDQGSNRTLMAYEMKTRVTNSHGADPWYKFW